MSDNSDQFVLYHKWFGIRPEEMPTHAYRLLGIALYEDDADVIENAVQSRVNYVSQFVTGEHAEAARTIVDELKQVEQCLLNPELKAAYDQQIRQAELDRLAASTVQAAATLVQPIDIATQVQPVVAESAPAFTPLSTPATRPLSRRRVSKPKKVGVEIAKIVVGGIAGIGIGLAVLVLVKGTQEDTGGSDSTQTEQPSRSVAVERPRSKVQVERVNSQSLTGSPETPSTIDGEDPNNVETKQTTGEPKTPLGEGNPFGEANPPKTVGQGTTENGVSVATNDPTTVNPKPKPVDPFEQVPHAISLPSLLTREPKALFSLGDIPTEHINLELVTSAVNLPENQAFQILRNQDPTVLSWDLLLVERDAQSGTSTPLRVAVMSIVDKALTFHWFEEAVGTAARQLQNCLLRFVVGQQTHTLMLRQTTIENPLKLDMDQRVNVREIALEQLPDREQLQFEVTSFENFPAQTEFKNGVQSANIAGEIDLEMKATGGAYLRIKTARRSDDELSLLVYPMYKVNSTEQIDLTTTRMGSMKTGTTEALASAEHDLAASLTEYKGLETQFNTLKRSSTRNPAQAAIKQQQLSAIDSKAKSCSRRIASLQRRIQELNARLTAIPQVEQLVSSLHQKAQLSVRIFVTIDGREVTLYKAG